MKRGIEDRIGFLRFQTWIDVVDAGIPEEEIELRTLG
jgi:hypothetical protein